LQLDDPSLAGRLYAKTTQEAKQFPRHPVENKAKTKTNRTTNSKGDNKLNY
jgi:hypothetical protein